jgi:hypothetical protein
MPLQTFINLFLIFKVRAFLGLVNFPLCVPPFLFLDMVNCTEINIMWWRCVWTAAAGWKVWLDMLFLFGTMCGVCIVHSPKCELHIYWGLGAILHEKVVVIMRVACTWQTNTQPDSSNLQFMHSKSFLVTVLKNNTYMSKWNITALSASYTEIWFTNCNYLKNKATQDCSFQNNWKVICFSVNWKLIAIIQLFSILLHEAPQLKI